jgi:hypothetical protein
LVLDTPYLKLLVVFFNLGLLNFIVAGLALRFVFPHFSREGRGLTLVFSWPLKRTILLTANLLSAGVVIWLAGIVLAAVSNYWLIGRAFWLFVGLSGCLSAMIIVLSASFGIFYPQFNYQSIREIEGSAGAIFFMVVSMFYLFFSLGLLALPFRDFYFFLLMSGGHLPSIGSALGNWLLAGLDRWTGWFMVVWLGLQAGLGVGLIYLANRRLNEYEV